MTKVTILHMNLMMDAKEIKKKIDENHVLNLRHDVPDYSPTFSPSKSIINVKRPFLHFWQRRKKIVILTEGEPYCWEFSPYPERDQQGNEVHGHIDIKTGEIVKDDKEPVVMRMYISNVFGGLRERKQFTEKVSKKMAAERKDEGKGLPISWPMLVMCGLLGAVVVLQLLTMRGVKI